MAAAVPSGPRRLPQNGKNETRRSRRNQQIAAPNYLR